MESINLVDFLRHDAQTYGAPGSPSIKRILDACLIAAHGIDKLSSELEQVKRERDAVISELANSCYACRFILDNSRCEGCFQRNGKYPWSPMVRTKFEWRGVCPENTKEDAKNEVHD